MATTAPRILYAYGVFLCISGLIAFAMSGYEARAKTAIIMGCGCGIVMWLCAYFGATRPSLIKCARYLTICFFVLFAYRGWKIRAVEEKLYLWWTFMYLCAGSAIALVMLMKQVGVDAKASKSAPVGRGKSTTAAPKNE